MIAGGYGMNFFEESNGALICRENGETIRIDPWLKDSFRVRSGMLSELQGGEIALLPTKKCRTQITVSEKQAAITNGKLTALIQIQREGSPRISYYKQNGEILLREIADGDLGNSGPVIIRHYRGEITG